MLSPLLCLNPCSNGIWSLTDTEFIYLTEDGSCLNPCSNGIWSLTGLAHGDRLTNHAVLILVLMEYGL